ncbi:hypothetical protein [Blastochloris tepida]|uniref:Uncharacterized protein n=1 Tax=Blastochloris tepida TaxID=2233851 RepID=A0A348G1J2_9HYPH|nr:hypothetical protein [Blastochloris tepida]BBF93425.1 hypothetical protein BLTE_21100 [Blastochloris tepida]
MNDDTIKTDDERPDFPEDDALPDWAAPLTAGPIPVTSEATVDDLAAIIAPRLEALMRVYGAEPTPEGWRRLAIGLALSHEPSLRMWGVHDRPHDEPGRRKDRARLEDGWRLQKEAKRTGLPLSDVIEAHRRAERKAGRKVLAASTLYEAVRDARKIGGNLADFALRQTFEAAALKAATELERK